jgi:hypothetical protein
MKIMRRQNSPIYIAGLMLFIASCSSPRYTYNFDYYDYNSGRKDLPNTHVNESLLANKTEPLKLDRNQLVAAADPDILKNSRPSSSVSKDASTATKAYKELSRSEKKHLRNELKDYIKNHSKKLKAVDEVASVNATKQLDDDLKLAIIFGAIGITFAILGGINTVFWVIGVIGLIVGLVFFIRWISTQ